MAEASPQAQIPVLSVPNPPWVDEESPLLTKRSSSSSRYEYSHTTGKEANETGELNKSKILWIMSSIWLGTFVVGLAGVGGGCVNTVSTVLVSDLVPLRQRGIWQGIGNVFWGLGNGLGGVFGGYVNDTWDWRIAFIAQVPFTLVSLLIVCVLFDAIRSRDSQKPANGRSSIARVDFLGSFLLVLTLVLFLMGLTTGGNIVPWTHPLAWATLPSSAILFCGFIYVEQKVAREPILPLNFLHDRTVLCACLTNWLSLMTMYTFIFYLPIYYRIRGISTAQAGAALVPFSVGLSFGSLVSGTIATKTGRYRYLLWVILILMLAATISSCVTTLTTPLWLPNVYLGSMGVATGGVLVVTLVALLSSVAPSDQAVMTSLSYIFRSTGAVVGLCVASAVYQQVLEKDLWARFGGLKNAGEVIHGIRDDAVNGQEKLYASLEGHLFDDRSFCSRGSGMWAFGKGYETSVYCDSRGVFQRKLKHTKNQVNDVRSLAVIQPIVPDFLYHD
ncbi:MAG: hypothetical protein Q9225_000338 [Loekoesia sp. 1 TL-2023]